MCAIHMRTYICIFNLLGDESSVYASRDTERETGIERERKGEALAHIKRERERYGDICTRALEQTLCVIVFQNHEQCSL